MVECSTLLGGTDFSIVVLLAALIKQRLQGGAGFDIGLVQRWCSADRMITTLKWRWCSAGAVLVQCWCNAGAMLVQC